MKRLQKVPHPDRLINTIQDNTDKVFRDIQSNPEASANHLPIAVKASGDTIVDHGLGRPYTAFTVAGSDADVRVWTSATINNNKALQLILNASADANITLKVY